MEKYMVHNDLTQGNITKKLVSVALPIMGTSFLQMAYNIVDMIWIGKVGSDSVAAVGTAGYFMWLSMALITLAGVGSDVNVAQRLGAKDSQGANKFAVTSFSFALVMGLIYCVVLLLFRTSMIGFFQLGDPLVEQMGSQYLQIIALGMPFAFMNPILSGMYNASGLSKIPFRVNSIGLALNLVLDPLFIFGLNMGVRGAALATIMSQMTATSIFVYLLVKGNRPYEGFSFRLMPRVSALKKMIKISLPVSIQSGMFTLIAMFVARIVADFGTTAIAVQKVGTQVEAISYMTANGFGAALSAFTGQNLGAGQKKRVIKGFKSAGRIIIVIGVITSLTLFVGAEFIFGLFIDEQPALAMGTTYFRILSFSQLFMCVEITLAGGFNGLGKSLPPAIISIGFNALRIPAAFFLATYTALQLNGVWWAISFSSVFKGTAIVIVLLFVIRQLKKEKQPVKI
jgi:putative MATE family efflux protein